MPAEQIREAARILGTAQRLLSTVLQGFYQSHQATAAAVQVNNINIVRGMLGKPGAGVLQMNGQPSAENTRECGADGDLPGFRNWANDSHVADLARIWNLEQAQIPHYAAPTHLMQMMRYVEQGTIRFLWVTGTNPEPGLLLLADLRHLHRVAAGVSLDWELLAQGAQAAKDSELLPLARRCHPQSLRQMRWANAMLKVLSPQVLAS